jgi:hypothetical protein
VYSASGVDKAPADPAACKGLRNPELVNFNVFFGLYFVLLIEGNVVYP